MTWILSLVERLSYCCGVEDIGPGEDVEQKLRGLQIDQERTRGLVALIMFTIWYSLVLVTGVAIVTVSQIPES